MRAVIAGGGTAGHAYPAAALADVLRSRGTEITFIGTRAGPEARLASERGYSFESIEVLGRKKGFNLHNLKVVVKLAAAVARSLALLGKIDPDVVVVTGGYVSLPVALATGIHRIPLVVHEQNTVFGLANRIASRLAEVVAVSFPGSESKLGPRARLTGNPIRAEISNLDRDAARNEALAVFGLAPGRRTLLVAGGSQGARSINEAAAGIYERWRSSETIQVLHLTGPRNVEEVEAALDRRRGADDRILWRVLGYTDRMDLAYAAADFAVCRAGATTIAELAAAGLPSILVPYPHAVDADQLRNAEAAVEAGGAVMILDRELKPTVLAEHVKPFLLDEERLARKSEGMRRLHIPDAAGRLANLVLEVAGGRGTAEGPRPERDPPAAPLAAVGDRLGVPWRRVHLVGIGGAGMSAIARVLGSAGVQVTGSDLSDSTTLAALRTLGMKVEVGHTAEHVTDADAVVASAAVPDDNVELAAARSKGIEVVSRGEALARILSKLRVVAVSGTHGKTTTSGMVATVLEKAGLDPTWVIGADLKQGGAGGKLGLGEVAVAEADEAYGSFLALRSRVALVLNVDADHLDYYGSMEAIEDAFRRFVAGAEHLIVCTDDERAGLLDHKFRTTYGLTGSPDVTASEVVVEAGRSRFLLIHEGRTLGEVELSIGGRRNVENALGAAAVCLLLELPPEAVIEGLGAFRGVSRRFEYRGSVSGADLVDDYAHHPREITATLSDARWGPWSRIVAVFQPHLYSRTRTMSREFGAALCHADVVVVTDVYGAREDPVPGVTGKLVAEAACEAAPAKRVAYLPRLDEAAEFVREGLRPGDLILSLGAGDVTTFPDRLMAWRADH